MMRVTGDFTPHSHGCPDNLAYFVHFHLLTCASGSLGHHPTGGSYLNQVGTIFDGVTRGPATIIGTVADRLSLTREVLHQIGTDTTDVRMTTGYTHPACGNNAWTINPTRFDRISHRIHCLSTGANITNSREARHQGIHGVVN